MKKEETSIDKVTDMLKPIAEKYEPLGYLYWVIQSVEGEKINEQNMGEHDSMEDYCEDCIDDAVESKHREWSVERSVLMGNIYEAEQNGFYTFYGVPESRGKNYAMRKEKTTPKHIIGMKRKLKREYRIGTRFSKDYINLKYGHETEGFKSCQTCDRLFNTSLLLYDDELSHWESEDYDYTTIEPREAYELMAIFEEGGGENHKLNERVKKLADRILNIMKKNGK